MATISAPFDEVLDWLLDTVVVRPGLPELVAAHDPLIISAGLPRADRAGARARRRRRHGRREPHRGRPDGLAVDLPRAGRLRGVRRAVQAGRARRHGAVRLRRRRHLRPLRLARGRRACSPATASRAYLDEQGVAYEPLRDLHDVREALARVGHAGRAYDRTSPCSSSPSRTTSSPPPSASAPTAPTGPTSGTTAACTASSPAARCGIEAAPGGVEVEPFDDEIAARRDGCSERRSTSRRFWAWARDRAGAGRAAQSRCADTGRRSSPTRGRCSST